VRRGGRLGERVIGRVAAAGGQPADGDGPGCAGGFAGKGSRRAGAVQGDGVPTDHAQQRGAAQVEGCRGAAIINLVVGRNTRDGQCLGGDVRAGAGLAEGVVGRVGAAEGQSADRHGVGGAVGLAGKGGRGAGALQGDGVFADDAQPGSGAQVEGCRGVAVVRVVTGGR